MGEQAKSDALLEQFVDVYAQESPYIIAMTLAYRNEADLAFSYLEKAVEVKDWGLWALLVRPEFSNLYQDPRWPLLLERLGRSPEHNEAIEFDFMPPEY